MDNLGVPLFLETPIYTYTYSYTYTCWKFNSSPWKVTQTQKERGLPVIIFQGELLNFGGVYNM